MLPVISQKIVHSQHKHDDSRLVKNPLLDKKFLVPFLFVDVSFQSYTALNMSFLCTYQVKSKFDRFDKPGHKICKKIKRTQYLEGIDQLPSYFVKRHFFAPGPTKIPAIFTSKAFYL